MSNAELRATHLYDLAEQTQSKHPVSYEAAFNSIPGAWVNDGMTAEEEIEAINSARVSGKTREILDL